MSLDAKVLHAGVDPEEWELAENRGYILWNKTRVDPVCNPMPLDRMASRNPGMHFVSTFGRTQPNVNITGKLGYLEAKDIIRHAGVYLSTTKETFGIGTLEAMAAGVPVLGWAFGGNLDIVKHMETGYLAPEGDYAGLQAGLEYVITNRNELGIAARESVLRTFTWDHAVEECAELYREAHNGQGSPKVAVIVTCYNLEEYLPECLDSVLAQEFDDWECIVVDDCSQGNCEDILTHYVAKDARFKYTKTPKNLYLAGARNWGISHTNAKYIMPLDADDMLNPRSLDVLSDALDKEPGTSIAFGSMELLEPDGRRWVSSWPPPFDWGYHMNRVMAHYNTLPYASMFRREVWKRIGGYRERCQTAEDADFWTRAVSFGARPTKATDYPTLLYRNRPDSMSRENEWPDVTVWYPWARKKELTPFGVVGKADNDMSWPVKTYDDPIVTVVIPVGPGHENIVRDALDSVLAQTEDRWEAIVVSDTPNDLDLMGYPWVRVIQTPNPGSGPAVARNIGIEAANTDLIALLDADDYLLPTFLSESIAVQAQYGGYVYADYFKVEENGEHNHVEVAEFEMMDLLWKGLLFAVTCLMPKAAWKEVGGFDPNCGGWEDWDLFFALATKEICGTRISKPLWCYRYYAGQRRLDGYSNSEGNRLALVEKWKPYTEGKGERLMGCRGCGKGGGARNIAVSPPMLSQISVQEVAIAEARGEGLIKMEYTGESSGTISLKGPRSRQMYRIGANNGHRDVFVYAVDVDGLEMIELPGGGKLKRKVLPAEEIVEPPQMRHTKSRVGVLDAS